jgi:hypothetical protein
MNNDYIHVQKILKKTVCHLIQAGLLLGLVFDPEYGGDIFLRNVCLLSTGYTAPCLTFILTASTQLLQGIFRENKYR